MYVHKTKITVRYSETDQMGIVHHSRYYSWFEVARGEHLAHGGITYLDCEKAGIWIPVLETHCRYRSPARYLQELTILSHLSELTPVKGTYTYQVYAEEQLLAEGFTKHVFTNDRMKPVNLKKANPMIWGVLEKLYQEDSDAYIKGTV